MNMLEFIKYYMYRSYEIIYLTDEQIIDFLKRNDINPEQDSTGWNVLYNVNLEKKEFEIKLVDSDFNIIAEIIPIIIDIPEKELEIIDLTK